MDDYQSHQLSTYALTLFRHKTQVESQKLAVGAHHWIPNSIKPRNNSFKVAKLEQETNFALWQEDLLSKKWIGFSIIRAQEW